MSVCLSVCLSVCVPDHLSLVCISVCSIGLVPILSACLSWRPVHVNYCTDTYQYSLVCVTTPPPPSHTHTHTHTCTCTNIQSTKDFGWHCEAQDNILLVTGHGSLDCAERPTQSEGRSTEEAEKSGPAGRGGGE